MTNKGIDIQHPKLRGEWAELCFMTRAAEHGLRVSKPFGDCARYDVTVEHNGQFLRVQVKSTQSSKKKGSHSYACDIRRRGREPYTLDQVDFFAVYAIPCNVWYIFPAKVAIASQANLTLTPDLPGSKHAPYKEAWHLLFDETKKTKKKNHPRSRQDQDKDKNQNPDSDENQNKESSQPETIEASPQDEPISPVEARFRAIHWNPILPPHWKPRR